MDCIIHSDMSSTSRLKMRENCLGFLGLIAGSSSEPSGKSYDFLSLVNKPLILFYFFFKNDPFQSREPAAAVSVQSGKYFVLSVCS